MNISIITPHYNDLEGLRHIYGCLQCQTMDVWEWIIVDDLSDKDIQTGLTDWHKGLEDSKVRIIFNSSKTNASVCRNIGADAAVFDHLVFLDSDDYISEEFVANRFIDIEDFAVFINYAIVDKKGDMVIVDNSEKPHLNSFLAGNFIWQTSCVLWHKPFFTAIGKFHPELPRLQDVELAIRALQQSTHYNVMDSPVDFYYKVKPIRARNHFVKPVCDAVYLLIVELLDTGAMGKQQLSLLSGYYYTCTRYLERSESTKDLPLVDRNLKLFFKKRYISFQNYIVGACVLKLYAWHLMSGKQFLRINRYLYKPKTV